jgi:exodeoxyribonuclease-3
MQITTWNVNGLRATLSKGTLEWLQTQPTDVVCLQEIKARPEQLEESLLRKLDSLPYII